MSPSIGVLLLVIGTFQVLMCVWYLRRPSWRKVHNEIVSPVRLLLGVSLFLLTLGVVAYVLPGRTGAVHFAATGFILLAPVPFVYRAAIGRLAVDIARRKGRISVVVVSLAVLVLQIALSIYLGITGENVTDWNLRYASGPIFYSFAGTALAMFVTLIGYHVPLHFILEEQKRNESR